MERRISCGESIETKDGFEASDRRDEELLLRCRSAIESLRPLVTASFRMRLIAEATSEGENRTIVARRNEQAIVTTPEHFPDDVLLLASAADPEDEMNPEWEVLPFVWLHGSAAVLLHEAVGHPAEHGAPAPELPSWLRVDVPLASRRASFRDVPLMRMTTLHAQQLDAPFLLPAERLEVQLVDGGSWDPLADEVTLRIAAASVITSNGRRTLAPFTFRAPRRAIVRSIAGAAGEPMRYPGVICARDGQELVVGSYAPALVTTF